MSEPVIRGDMEPKRQVRVEQWSPLTGFVSESEYKTFDERWARNWAATFARRGIEYHLTIAHGVCTLRAVDAVTRTYTIDTWEIGINRLSPSALENPVVIANVGVNDVERAAGLAILRGYIKGEKTYDEAKDLLTPVPYSVRVLDLLAKGQDAYYKTGYVLRHTTNAPNRYTANVADDNVDAVYTTAQLFSEVTDGDLWIFPLPDRLVYKLQTVTSMLISRHGTHSNFQWGWLKSGGAESTAADTRVNIVTEYEFDEWTTDYYVTV